MMKDTTKNSSEAKTRDNRSKHTIANWFFLKISGGPFYAYCILKHIGRKSGREYVTPVSAYPLGDGFVLALLYGDANSVDWCRNILSTGQCKLATHGKEHVLKQPEIIPAEQALTVFPKPMQRMYKTRGIQQFLWIHKAS
jgi:hypothetical protein